jgi:arylsulfatase A-like enzyme
MRAVYDGRWHFLAYTDGRTELFDVSRDPQESENLAAREPAEAARLSALLPAVR